MSMEQEKKMFDAVTEIRGDFIEQAAKAPLGRRRLKRKKWGVLAACAVLAAGACGLLQYMQFLPPGTGGTGSGGGNGGHAEGTAFMSYAGPVLPLTLRQPREDLTARRRVTFDFSLAAEEDMEIWGAGILDDYTIRNTSDREMTASALYPFTGDFDSLSRQMPSIAVNGRPVEPVLFPGSYAGGFTGAYGDGDPGGSENLKHLDSWEGYKALLTDGSYREEAFSPDPVLPQKVTVYEFSDYQAPLEEYQAATQAISFSIDPDETTVLQYGFEGMEWQENGFRRYSYFVPDGRRMHTERKMLIVLGRDIGPYALQGYQNGGCEPGNELEGVSARVTRSEMVLQDAVSQLVTDYFSLYRDGVDENGCVLPGVSREMFTGAAAELLYQYGQLSDSVADRYKDGSLTDIFSETQMMQRVFYLEFPIVLPPGASVSVRAGLHKEPSFDYACSGSENAGLQGYDMVTRLDSSLRFEALTAELRNAQAVEIVRQNFGFNLSRGITEVQLDPAGEHYYLELRPARETS